MGFSINTNVASMLAYNAMLKSSALAEKAQFRLATTKKVNSVSDNTTAYYVGKSLESQIATQKSQLGNVSSAKNYLATAETSLEQINDKLGQISAKYIDSQDVLKDRESIVEDIRTLASEINSILKNTSISGQNLLAQSDGSPLTSNQTYNVGGSAFYLDFASDDYLKAGDLKSLIEGGTISDAGATIINGTSFSLSTPYTAGDQTSTVKATYADGTSETWNINLHSIDDMNWVKDHFIASSSSYLTDITQDTSTPGQASLTLTPTKNIVKFETISGYDITSALGISYQSAGDSQVGGLLDTDDATVLSVASDVTTVVGNVRSALGRIGNLVQTLDSRSEFLTSSIANNTEAVSILFDADMAEEQLNATRHNISSQLSSSILSQLNNTPQQILSLFK